MQDKHLQQDSNLSARESEADKSIYDQDEWGSAERFRASRLGHINVTVDSQVGAAGITFGTWLHNSKKKRSFAWLGFDAVS